MAAKICSWTYGNGFPTNCTRSFILLGVIREIVDIYHLHILYYNVNDYNMNHTTSEANALNIFCNAEDYYNVETGTTGQSRSRKDTTKGNNNKKYLNLSGGNQKYFACESEMLRLGMDNDLKTYVQMVSEQLRYVEGPAFKAGKNSVSIHFRKLQILRDFFGQPSFIRGYEKIGVMSRTSLESKLNDVHANQLLVNIKNNYREKDGITIFKILIERCGSNSTNGFLKDPQLRKVLLKI